MLAAFVIRALVIYFSCPRIHDDNHFWNWIGRPEPTREEREMFYCKYGRWQWSHNGKRSSISPRVSLPSRNKKSSEEKTRQQIILHNSNLFAVRRGRRRSHQAENQFCQLLGSRKRKFHDIYWINCLRRRVGNEIIVLTFLFRAKH